MLVLLFFCFFCKDVKQGFSVSWSSHFPISDRFLQEREERLLGLHDGIGTSFPRWAEKFFSSFAWTRERLVAMLQSLPRQDDVHVSPRQLRCPAFLCQEHVPPEPHVEPIAVDPQTSTPLRKPLKPTKWGRCSACQAPRKPWIFKTGNKAGQAAWICTKLFNKHEKRCFAFLPMTEKELADQPRWFRNQYSTLEMRLKRAGRVNLRP